MSKGDELFALRERLLEYLYDEGAISARVPIESDKAVAALNTGANDYDIVCSNLKKAELIEGITSPNASALHVKIWLTEKGLNHVQWKRVFDETVDTDILEERLSALLEMKRVYYRRLNRSQLDAAELGYVGESFLTSEIDSLKAKIVEVDQQINEIKQHISEQQS